MHGGEAVVEEGSEVNRSNQKKDHRSHSPVQRMTLILSWPTDSVYSLDISIRPCRCQLNVLSPARASGQLFLTSQHE